MKTKPQSMKEQTITTGTTVTWTSQSQGSATTKTGIVVAVVPPNEHPLPYAPVEAKIDAIGMPRPKESYLVKVEGRKLLYWPHASRLKVVEQPKPSAVSGGRGCEVSASHTPGPWRSVAVEGGWNGVADSGGAIICKLSLNEPANADFIAEAGTVAHETGLTPRQLADQRAELLEALKDSVEPMEKLIRYFAGSLLEHKFNDLRFVARDINQAIAKAEGKEGN